MNGQMKTILLVGSSIFHAWGEAKGLAPGQRIVNRAIGGTITSYWVESLSGVLAEESPDVTMLYCGSNDLNNDVSDQEIIANVAQCCSMAHAQSPAARFAYFGIIKAPEKLGKWDRIDRINATIRDALPDGDLYVETNDVFFPEGKPVERFYVEDGLHLTEEAYTEMAAYAQPILAEWMG
jgi:lysophospholipase L1-like esterase